MDDYWSRFRNTGSVMDYLNYKRKANESNGDKINMQKEAAANEAAASTYRDGHLFSAKR